MRRTFAVWIAAPAFALTVCLLIAFTGFFKFVVMFIMTLSDWKIFRNSLIAPMFRPTPSIVLRWCSSRKDLKTGNSRAQEITALPVIEASKNLSFIVLWVVRWILC